MSFLKTLSNKFGATALNLRAALNGGMLAVMVLSPAAFADDTEIFFGQAGLGPEGNPNILFLLDTSGSMTSWDAANGTNRMDSLKSAMYQLLDQSSDYNVGLMAFNGGGGSIRYPVGYLEGASDSDCPDTGCENVIVDARTGASADDAVENNTTGEVVLDSQYLDIGERTTTDSSTTPSGPTKSGESGASSSVAEAFPRVKKLISQPVHVRDESSDQWFYHSSLGTYDTRKYAYRFPNIKIPVGATVTAAKIVFQYDDPSVQQGVVSAYISAEATADPEAYPDASQIPTPDPQPLLADRHLTKALVPWKEIPEGGSADISTPDIKDLLQEVIGLPGWTGGKSMSIVIDPFESVKASTETMRQFKGVGALLLERPRLYYEYVEGNSNPSSVGSYTASSHSTTFNNPSTQGTSWNNSATRIQLFFLNEEHEPGTGALRFENINIPKDATITSAKLNVKINGSGTEIPITVSAENTHEPEPFNHLALSLRSQTTAFIEWDQAAANDGEKIESPDISGILQELIELDDWVSGSPVSLFLTPGAGYVNDGTQIINFDSSSGDTPPELVVSWTVPDTTTTTTVDELTTGVRFSSLHVPPGAIIKSAFIEFTSEAATAENASFSVAAENVPNSAPFSNTAFDISQRTLTTNRETWEPDPWDTVGSKFQTLDITRVIQEVTDQSNWCGGNALSLIMNGSGHRQTVSHDANPVGSPKLRVSYSPESINSGGYCSNSSVLASVAESADDAVEFADGSVVIDSATLGLATGNTVGLRFRGLQLEQGAEISSAVLELGTATDLAGGNQIKISAQAIDNAQPYYATNNNITGRTTGSASVTWGPVAPTESETSIYSNDITPVISEVINRTNWVKGNSLSLKLEPSRGATADEVMAIDGTESLSASLIIYYKDTREDAATTIREALKNEVADLNASGATPIMGAMFEAASYLRGMPIDFGDVRNYGWGSTTDAFFRVSHPFSYTGGELDRPSGCTAANLGDAACIGERINNSPVYTSPISNQCQQTHLVVLSDGAPNGTSATTQIKSMLGIADCEDLTSGSQCGKELAEWLYTTDHAPTIPGDQTVTTHTIAFAQDTPAFLEMLAEHGGGDFYAAESATDLVNAFKSIFNKVSKSDSSFVAPSTSVNQFNRLKHRDDLYFAQFKPESTARWNGNLKKYKVLGAEGAAATIIDANGNPAVDPNLGQFNASAQSFWSTVVDGPEVTKGGAASKFEGKVRNVYTFNGKDAELSLADNAIGPDNGALDVELFNLPPERFNDLDYRASLRNWAAGKDVHDEDSDGAVDDARTQMGDPMHSQPLLLNYASTGAAKSVVYIGTNEGYLHAIDHLTGFEEFAFIPPELLKNLQKFHDNDPERNRVYGLDGDITAWVGDENSNGVIDPDETAILYIGMRRGGSNYYALDVSDPENPFLKFVIQGGKNTSDTDLLTADGDFRELAQTWSKPQKTQVMSGGSAVDVLIFGGGYDPNQDPGTSVSTGDSSGSDAPSADASRRKDGIGRSIFIVDAESGSLIWNADLDDPDFSAMQYSIPSDIRMVDINADGMTDQLYFGDMGGQIWRFDIDNNTDVTDPLDKRISGGLIAEFAGDAPEEARRFYYPPDLAVINVAGRQELSVSIGSGWRAHPLHVGVKERFYSFRLSDVYTAPFDNYGQIVYDNEKLTSDSSELKDVTNTLGLEPGDIRGWYIDLEDEGEKVLSSSITLNNQLIFTTYSPSKNEEICSAAVGSGSVYAVSIFNGDPIVDLDGSGSSGPNGEFIKSQRKKDLTYAGIPPSPSVIFPEVGDATILLGPETLPEVDIGEPKRRTFWQELLDENS